MSKFNFEKIQANLSKIQSELPLILANDVQNYTLDAFKKQGYDGKRWAQVQRRIEGTPEYRYPKTKGLSRRTKPILVLSGALRRAASNLVSSAKVSKRYDGFKMILSINASVIPYAGYLNDGTNNMVARPFLKRNRELDQIVKNRITNYIDRLWQV
jgi:hypothetical protein